jgi:hypothetical protein
LALRQYQVLDLSETPLCHITSRDLILSYDIACGYIRYLVERFKKVYPDFVPAVQRTRCIIPAVHIQNHQDNCMYIYSGAYTSNAGHFHGETAEQYWVELNQLGPQTRQMNNGHRQDCIIDSHNDWNWKKTRQMRTSLPFFLTSSSHTHLLRRNSNERPSPCAGHLSSAQASVSSPL